MPYANEQEINTHTQSHTIIHDCDQLSNEMSMICRGLLTVIVNPFMISGVRRQF